jgi:hypothetical protein
VLWVSIFAVAVSIVWGCAGQAPPPALQSKDVSLVTMWVRDEATWDLEQQRVFSSYGDPTEIGRFVDAWATLEPLRPSRPTEWLSGVIEVHVSLSGGRHWTLSWQPAIGENIFRLTGFGGPDMDRKSPMKLQSDEMVRLLQGWVGS